jgi:hypothetical protein
MFTKPDTTHQKTRKQSTEEINRAMSRFPLIVEILGQLDKSEVPLPGDNDIRHGCQRALTAIMVELARIEPAASGKPSKSEAAALELLNEEESRRLIDADQLQRMQQFIERVLGTYPKHH